MEQVRTIEGVEVPSFLYGTAWKEAATQELTELAIAQGFRGIDTANQRKHYDEAAVGRGITAAMAGGQIARDDLFLQTKYTFRQGQDHRLPYNPAAPIPTQVEESFASSLEHLGVDRIDSYLLHGPSRSAGLGVEDWAAWQAMEKIHESGRARLLGVSNVSLEQLEILCKDAKVKPHFVQNRCYAVRGWDRDGSEVLQCQRYCLSGIFAVDGQPRRDGQPAVGDSRPAPRLLTCTAHFPIRHRRGDDPVDRYHGRNAHAAGPRDIPHATGAGRYRVHREYCRLRPA